MRLKRMAQKSQRDQLELSPLFMKKPSFIMRDRRKRQTIVPRRFRSNLKKIELKLSTIHLIISEGKRSK
jgi:hypothetical protein